MNCSKIKELLSAYADGMLNEDEKKLVEEHCSKCPSCRDELELVRLYIEETGSLQRIKAPDDFLDKVHARINKKSFFDFLFVRGLRKFIWEFAGVMAAVLIAVLVFHPFKGVRKTATKDLSNAFVAREKHEMPEKVLSKEGRTGESQIATAIVKPSVTGDVSKERKICDYVGVDEESAKECRMPFEQEDNFRSRESAPALPEGVRSAEAGFDSCFEEKKKPSVVKDFIFSHKKPGGREINLSDIKNIVIRLGGEIIEEEPQYVFIEISGSRYDELKEKISVLGKFELKKETKTKMSEKTCETHVRIKILQ